MSQDQIPQRSERPDLSLANPLCCVPVRVAVQFDRPMRRELIALLGGVAWPGAQL